MGLGKLGVEWSVPHGGSSDGLLEAEAPCRQLGVAYVLPLLRVLGRYLPLEVRLW